MEGYPQAGVESPPHDYVLGGDISGVSRRLGRRLDEAWDYLCSYRVEIFVYSHEKIYLNRKHFRLLHEYS